jgi:signal transduction histidine kinase
MLQTGHGTFRFWPLLVLAFGCVILLMIGSDVATIERARRLHAAVLQANEAYHANARELEQLRSGIHLSSLLLRDYLLDPRAERTATYRTELLDLKAQIDDRLQKLHKLMPSRETAKLAEMRTELDAYWDTFDPMFAWTSQERYAYSFGFLRHRVIPKRESVLRLAADVEALNETLLQEQGSRIAELEAEFSAFLQRAVIISLVGGLLVAFASIFRVSQLERRSERQHIRTLSAENEMRRLSQQLVHAQEEERKAISRELHDEIGQMLTGLRMEFRTLSRMNGVPAKEFQSHIEEGKLLLDQALQCVRDTAMGLRPSMLDDLGLEAALQWQSRDFCRRHDIPVNVTVRADLSTLQDRYKTNLYRIVQEALTNCARHANARSISIAVDQDGDRLRLVIRDDGIGIKASGRGKGLGLIGIQERARELGGTARIEPGPSQGTVLTVIMPAQQSAACV